MDRYVARKAVLADLTEAGLLVSEKPHKMVVPRCGRTGEVVEPMLTDQWFVAMTKPAPATHPLWPGKSIQDLCLAAVGEGVKSPRSGETGTVEFVPKEWIKTYLEWINNIQDWCISRQLWWGHRIPAWYCTHCQTAIVARTAPSVCTKCGGKDLTQDEEFLHSATGLFRRFEDLWAGLERAQSLHSVGDAPNVRRVFLASAVEWAMDLHYEVREVTRVKEGDLVRWRVSGRAWDGERPFDDVQLSEAYLLGDRRTGELALLETLSRTFCGAIGGLIGWSALVPEARRDAEAAR
jgi:isoleucyl-tRNA synthetase